MSTEPRCILYICLT